MHLKLQRELSIDYDINHVSNSISNIYKQKKPRPKIGTGLSQNTQFATNQLQDSFESLIPTFLKISSIKHHLVMDDCNKLAPTKMVNHNQFSLTYIPKRTLIITKVPAIARIYLLIIILNVFFYGKDYGLHWVICFYIFIEF